MTGARKVFVGGRRLLLVLSLVGVLAQAATAQAPIAFLRSVQGEVTYRGSSAPIAGLASNGQSLFGGDMVRTGRGGQAVLVCNVTRKSLVIYENSALYVSSVC